jgi:hypothetical protein
MEESEGGWAALQAAKTHPHPNPPLVKGRGVIVKEKF